MLLILKRLPEEQIPTTTMEQQIADTLQLQSKYLKLSYQKTSNNVSCTSFQNLKKSSTQYPNFYQPNIHVIRFK